MNQLTPVAQGERIVSLDVLRGFALLGILVMNIQAFAMPFCAYMNPTSFGEQEGINRWVWGFGHIFFEMKFMGLFSMLFGAGVLLFADRAEARKTTLSRVSWLHCNRNFWLVMFGLLHAHLLWSGDILFAYGVCAFPVYLFRRCSARTLLICGLIFLLIGSGLSLMFGLSYEQWPEPGQAELAQFWRPDQASLDAEIAQYSGGFAAGFASNSEGAKFVETFIFVTNIFWRVMGMMLLGMAFYRAKILSGERSDRFYRRLLVAGAVIGLLLIGIGLRENLVRDYAIDYSFYLGAQWNFWGSVALSMAYIGLVVGMVRSGAMPALQRRLGAVGQMAFTNYILQTVIGVVIFRVLGHYGSMERLDQLAMVVVIWALQLWLSPLWLARFRFGPLEWLWRIVTYRLLALQNFLALLLGLVVGMAFNMLLVISNLFFFPMPEGVTMDDQEGFSAWAAHLPDSAFILPMVAHLAQAFFGGWLAARLGTLFGVLHPMRLAMSIGVLSLVAGIMNALSLQIPTWMWIEMPFYLVLAWAAGNIEVKRRASLAV
ncbi:MAG: DUF418 domain-containing protein [Planctomycetota bacterium]|nr:DUF418 domain-containing protein [Planctomycetota bacterium]